MVRRYNSKPPIRLDEFKQKVTADQNLHDKILAAVSPEIKAILFSMKNVGCWSGYDRIRFGEALMRMYRAVSPGHQLSQEDQLRIKRTLSKIGQGVSLSDAELVAMRKELEGLVSTVMQLDRKQRELLSARQEQLELLQLSNRQLTAIVRANDLLIAFQEMQLQLPQLVETMTNRLTKLSERLGPVRYAAS